MTEYATGNGSGDRAWQGHSQDLSLRGVSVRAKRAGYVVKFLGERRESVMPAAGERFFDRT